MYVFFINFYQMTVGWFSFDIWSEKWFARPFFSSSIIYPWFFIHWLLEDCCLVCDLKNGLLVLFYCCLSFIHEFIFNYFWMIFVKNLIIHYPKRDYSTITGWLSFDFWSYKWSALPFISILSFMHDSYPMIPGEFSFDFWSDNWSARPFNFNL